MGLFVNKAMTAVALAGLALGSAAPAVAKPKDTTSTPSPTPTPTPTYIDCSNSDISPSAIDCAGFFGGNIINDKDENELVMAAALASLGFTYTGDSNGIEQFDAKSGTTVDFATLLFGQTIIGVHYGNGVGSPGRPTNDSKGDGDDTAFYLFNAGTAGLNTFTLAFNAASTVTLFQTGSPPPPPPPPPGVPEPATWAMMLMGFGAIGFGMRRRRSATLAQIA